MATDNPDNPEPAARPQATRPAAGSSPGAQPVSFAAEDLEPLPFLASREVVQLLVKAVGMLPDGERDQVYTWVLDRGLFTGPHAGPLTQRMRVEMLTQQVAGRAGAQPGGQQVVPVRFPADQHAELRSWCAEHGFSMATVIRGLVARFLEGQLRPDA